MDEYVQLPDLGNLSSTGTEWINSVLPDFSFDTIVNEIAGGENLFQVDKIFETVLYIFANELYTAGKILAVIIAIVLISSLLENLKSSFKRQSVISQGIVTTALIIGLSTKLFSRSVTFAATVSDDITKAMWAIFPIMTTLTAGSGFTTTGVITHPILFFMCNVFAEIFNKVLIPISVTYLVISLVDTMSDSIELGKFRELIKKYYNFILGIVMTVFTGVLSISSFVGVSLDSVGARGAKFAISSMVPFVGRSISDAMGAVASASSLLKNSVGVTGIVCILALCLIPIIKTAVIILSIRISAAVCEPIADQKTVSVLSSIGDSLSMINASVISIVMMMIIAISIIVGIR